MATADGAEPVADDELLYRRVPAVRHWYSAGKLSPQAFHPDKERDGDGISLWRAKHKTIGEAAMGRPGKLYYVAVLRAADLRRHGIEIAPSVEHGVPGHVSIPALNSRSRHSERAQAMEGLLAAELTLQVEGPFETPAPRGTKGGA